jgi:hypothetical protein
MMLLQDGTGDKPADVCSRSVEIRPWLRWSLKEC